MKGRHYLIIFTDNHIPSNKIKYFHASNVLYMYMYPKFLNGHQNFSNIFSSTKNFSCNQNFSISQILYVCKKFYALTKIKVTYYLKTPSECPVNKVSPLGSTDKGAHNNELPPDVYL